MQMKFINEWFLNFKVFKLFPKIYYGILDVKNDIDIKDFFYKFHILKL